MQDNINAERLGKLQEYIGFDNARKVMSAYMTLKRKKKVKQMVMLKIMTWAVINSDDIFGWTPNDLVEEIDENSLDAIVKTCIRFRGNAYIFDRIFNDIKRKMIY